MEALEKLGKVADVVIDFSRPGALPHICRYVKRTGTPLLSGTTARTDLYVLPSFELSSSDIRMACTHISLSLPVQVLFLSKRPSLTTASSTTLSLFSLPLLFSMALTALTYCWYIFVGLYASLDLSTGFKRIWGLCLFYSLLHPQSLRQWLATEGSKNSC